MPAAHHRFLIRALQDVAESKTQRLMVLMPPGSAKSTYASKLFPAWCMESYPTIQVLGASHTAGLSLEFSADVQRIIRTNERALTYGLETDRIDRWRTTRGGAYLSAGVAVGIAGFRADLVLIDDPIKSRADAESETYREKAWRWYMSDVQPRLRPGGRVVLIQTRWHEDDLAGRLLQTQPERWRVISLPAEAMDNDALGRQPGEWLWADDGYGYGAGLADAKAQFAAAGATRDWDSLYQQSPRALEGSLFKAHMVGTSMATQSGGRTVRAWDLAATAAVGTSNADYTVGLRLHRARSGLFTVEDVVRLRGGPDEVQAAILATAQRDGHEVRVSLPQDPGQAGKVQVLALTRLLTGYTVESSPESGDKVTRAAPVAAQCNIGNLHVLQAPWNAAFLDELAAFPSGRHDDQVDALSRAFSVVGVSRAPMQINPLALARG